MIGRVSHNPLNGRFTIVGLHPEMGWDAYRCCDADSGTEDSYEDAKSQKDSNYWSVTENSANNAWNVNFGSGNVNNNNNKYNTNNVVRPVAAFDGLEYVFDHLPEDAIHNEAFMRFFKTVHDAYRDCMRGKMSSPQALAYMQVAWADLPSLAWELWTGTYKPSTSTCFLVRYPKLREVFAANFRDRIVHHWICLRLEPLFEYRFVSQGDVSFNCRKGYGTEKCIKHCAEGMARVSDNYNKDAWVFRGDLVGFFMSIDKNMLWYLLKRFIIRWKKRYERKGWAEFGLVGMPEMYWGILAKATNITVMHHPENDCVLNSCPDDWIGLAPNKSLFGCGEEKGEPIGNLTTQLFANFLMSFFDQYVLYLFRRKNYSYERFVDDWDIACEDLDFLMKSIPKMEAFLRKLKLEMHKHKRYLQPVSHGVALVGSYIKPGRVYLSNRTLARFEERVVGFSRLINSKEELGILDCKRIEQVVNSYLGFCKGKATYNKRKEILGKLGGKFFKYFYIRGHYQSIRAKKKYRELALPYDIAA